jgi:hypothetical protein
MREVLALLEAPGDTYIWARKEAARVLRRILTTPKLLKQFEAAPPGRRRSGSFRSDLAIARHVRGLVLGSGRGKAKVAESDVAEMSGATTKQVERAYTEYRQLAQNFVEERLRRIGERSVGKNQPNGEILWTYWTRESILEAIWLDLQDAFKESKGKHYR